ncbi:MAG: hypothetical protein GY870_12920 [archaeon]|nr:hypothetical protein [archaeon]
MKFFSTFRKRGFGLTLEILEKYKKNEAKETDFFQKLKDNDSYLNEFYRVKKDLIECKLIGYKLDENYNKVIFLTEKGKTFLAKIKEINELIMSD